MSLYPTIASLLQTVLLIIDLHLYYSHEHAKYVRPKQNLAGFTELYHIVNKVCECD